MKKYKTWEAFKMLEENENLEFISDDGYKLTTNGILLILYSPIKNGPTAISGNVYINQEWELVKEPVDFMEAIKMHYTHHKTIYCEIDGRKYTYHWHGGKYEEMRSCEAGCLYAAEILRGKWYIQEDEE